jgi:acetyl/propionyl-CoA carboxylase alpha subunit
VISDPKHQTAKIIGQRDCSIQRKNQKIIEEIPSDFVDINNLENLENNVKIYYYQVNMRVLVHLNFYTKIIKFILLK